MKTLIKIVLVLGAIASSYAFLLKNSDKSCTCLKTSYGYCVDLDCNKECDIIKGQLITYKNCKNTNGQLVTSGKKIQEVMYKPLPEGVVQVRVGGVDPCADENNEQYVCIPIQKFLEKEHKFIKTNEVKINPKANSKIKLDKSWQPLNITTIQPNGLKKLPRYHPTLKRGRPSEW